MECRYAMLLFRVAPGHVQMGAGVPCNTREYMADVIL